MSKVLNIQSDNDEEDEASDGESDENSEEDGEDEDVEAEMRAELAKSKVFNDEEGGNIEDLDDVDRPLDVDAKVLKNLLESFNSQEDLAGPATTLLQPLGIDIRDAKL